MARAEVAAALVAVLAAGAERPQRAGERRRRGSPAGGAAAGEGGLRCGSGGRTGHLSRGIDLSTKAVGSDRAASWQVFGH